MPSLFTFARRTPWFGMAGLALSATLAGCGGGGGGSSATTGTPSVLASSLSGHAIDAAVPNATVTITSGAPLGDGGTSIGSFTTDSTGAYSGSVTLPSTNLPIFANVTGSSASLTMSSYIGQSTTLATLGTFSSTTNLPNLDITPVTTSALAVYGLLNGGNFNGLTPTGYASVLQTYGSTVLAIASGIKAIGDGYCQLPTMVGSTMGISTTTAYANALASTIGSANLGSGNALATVATSLTQCVSGFSLSSVSQLMEADPVFAPQLNLGEVIEPSLSTPQPLQVGQYQMQYVLAATGATVQSAVLNGSSIPLPTFVAPSTGPYLPASMPILSIDASGNITSSDNTVSGKVLGNLATLSVQQKDSGGLVVQTYQLNGKVGALPATLTSGGTAFSLMAAGPGNVGSPAPLARLEAVLVPWNGTTTTVTPVLTGLSGSSLSHGISCTSPAIALRLDLTTAAPLNSVETSFGASLGECLSTAAGSWTLSPGSTTLQTSDLEFDHIVTGGLSSATTSVSLSSPLTLAQTSNAFILQGNGSVSVSSAGNPVLNAVAAQFDYVLGTRDMVFGTTVTPQVNGLLHLQDVVQSSEYGHSVNMQPADNIGSIFLNSSSNNSDRYDH